MTLRPRAARWFELIAARDDAYLALEALANAGCVQIEWHAADAPPAGSAAALLRDYTVLARRHARYWPPARIHLGDDPRAPADALAAGVARLRGWADAAAAPIAELQQAEATLADLVLADQALAALADSRIDFSLLAPASHGVCAALFALPAGAAVPVPDSVLTRAAVAGQQTLMLAVGPVAAVEAMARAVTDANGRRARFPDWLQPSAAASREQLAQRRATLTARAARLRAELAQLNATHAVAQALGDIARATWCFEHGGAISLGERGSAADSEAQPAPVFARLTGWATDSARLLAAVEASPARALLAFPPPPRGARPPLVLANPWWARPFELFPRLVGMPGARGADPSMLLAFAVPLMFGYMFGDVGQGLTLAALGLLLARRQPVLRLLVPCGLAAAVFGLVFGSVFSLEHLIDPLWTSPLAAPLPVLVLPVVAGAVLLVLGLLLGLLQAWWQQQAGAWLREQTPVLLAYVGLLAMTVTPRAGWLVAAAIVAAPLLAASAAGAGGARLGPALGALGELVEHALQLAINTLSFARVGAFALAHAGLSSAVVALADATGHPVAFALVLLLGNLLIVAIEGLVVSIQTTRLVLFEFFTRFFKAEGREFRPLLPPPAELAFAEPALTKEG